jgi:hypothetical protein
MPLHQYLQPNRVVHVELGDHDALDTYTFRIDSVTDGLRVHWQMGRSDNGDLQFTAAALAGAHGFSGLSQGNVDFADDHDKPGKVQRSTPPFLLSREVFAALQSGPVAIHLPSMGEAVEFTLGAPGTRELTVLGETRSVAVLALDSERVEMIVLDDPDCPLVLQRSEWGEDTLRLLEISAG